MKKRNTKKNKSKKNFKHSGNNKSKGKSRVFIYYVFALLFLTVAAYSVSKSFVEETGVLPGPEITLTQENMMLPAPTFIDAAAETAKEENVVELPAETETSEKTSEPALTISETLLTIFKSVYFWMGFGIVFIGVVVYLMISAFRHTPHEHY